jgi:hypothetical protein
MREYVEMAMREMTSTAHRAPTATHDRVQGLVDFVRPRVRRRSPAEAAADVARDILNAVRERRQSEIKIDT